MLTVQWSAQKGGFQIQIRFIPLLPPIQGHWNGRQVADWPISTGIVDHSKRAIISEKLDGSLFLKGRVLNALSEDEVAEILASLTRKIDVVSILVWRLAYTSDDLRAPLAFF
jgi:hypothetical protein